MLYPYLFFNIANGAHHLDLRLPNPADPRDVIECRNLAVKTIGKWIGLNLDEKTENEQKRNIQV